MSKSLLAAKAVGSGVLGTGIVVSGGYGITQHLKSKESEVTSENKESISFDSQKNVPAANISTGEGEQKREDSVTVDTPSSEESANPVQPQAELKKPSEVTPSVPISQGKGETDNVSESNISDSQNSNSLGANNDQRDLISQDQTPVES